MNPVAIKALAERLETLRADRVQWAKSRETREADFVGARALLDEADGQIAAIDEAIDSVESDLRDECNVCQPPAADVIADVMRAADSALDPWRSAAKAARTNPAKNPAGKKAAKK